MGPVHRAAIAFALLVPPTLGSAVPVVLYPPDGPRSGAELGELAGILQSAMSLAAARGSSWRPVSLPRASPPPCGVASRASPACLAKVAGGGLVLLAIAGEGKPAPVELRVVDPGGRVAARTRTSVDLDIQTPAPLAAVIAGLEEAASSGAQAPATGRPAAEVAPPQPAATVPPQQPPAAAPPQAAAAVPPQPPAEAPPPAPQTSAEPSAPPAAVPGRRRSPNVPAPNGWTVGFRAGWGIPLGDFAGMASGSGKLRDEFSGQIPLWVEGGYRFDRRYLIGAYFQAGYPFVVENGGGLAGRECHIPGVASCEGNVSLRVGLQFLVDLLPAARFRPWAGVGAGYEIVQYKLSDSSGGSATVSYRGWELVNVQLGGEYVLTPRFRMGPFLVLSVGQYGEVSIASGGQSTDIAISSKKTHEWLQLGLRAVIDL